MKMFSLGKLFKQHIMPNIVMNIHFVVSAFPFNPLKHMCTYNLTPQVFIQERSCTRMCSGSGKFYSKYVKYNSALIA